MINIIKLKKNKISKSQKGFTLAEMIIVIGIIGLISSITLFDSRKLNSNILLSNTAYEIGLIIRDAQVSGLGSKLLEGATTSNQGVFFDTSKPEQVVLFSDTNNNNRFDQLSDKNQTYNIENKRAGKVLSICKVAKDNICQGVVDLNVVFKRPNPEAYFYTYGEQAEFNGNTVVNIGFDDGECKSIIIYKTGAVQIDKSYCN